MNKIDPLDVDLIEIVIIHANERTFCNDTNRAIFQYENNAKPTAGNAIHVLFSWS